MMKALMISHIRNTVTDLVADFLYYDRKEDEDLPRGAIEQAVANKTITSEDIMEMFREELTKGLGEDDEHQKTMCKVWDGF
ncbi:MAG: hypothetical protein JAY60_19570 [Candidatus Thiodiazotropha weberae]|nr:hypothetical protein [Candidatus Thiodiazotropha weberae]